MRRIFLTGLALMPLAPLALADGDGDGFQRESGRNGREAKDALEGKAPPPLSVTNWMNTGGEALDLAKLRGKVVAIKFWGVW